MTKGIFNPFVTPEKPKPNYKSPTLDMYDSEIGGPEPKGGVRLDGDSHVLWLKETNLDEVPQRLGEIFSDVAAKYPNKLVQYGINLIPLGLTYTTEKTDSVLKTPIGRLHVHVGENTEGQDIEILSFQRMAHALYAINVPDILTKHNAKIIVR